MKFCYHCGTRLTDNFTFCPNCGQKQSQVPAQPAPQYPPQPIHEAPPQPTYQPAPQPVCQPQPTCQYSPYESPAPIQSPAAPTVSKAGLILGKIGLALGIASLASGLLFNLIFLLLAVIKPNLGGFDSLSYEPFTLTLGIAAVVLSSIARRRGNYEKQSLLGLIFGIIGIVLGVLSIIMFLVFAGSLNGLYSDFSI